MTIDDFVRYSKVLHRLTADFVRAVPDDKWDFTRDPPGRADRVRAPHRIGVGFAPFCKQLAACRLCARCLQCGADDKKSGLDAKARALFRPAVDARTWSWSDCLSQSKERARNLIATAYVLTIEDPHRFRKSHGLRS